MKEISYINSLTKISWILSSVHEDSLVCLTYNDHYKFNILNSRNINYTYSKNKEKVYVKIKDIKNAMISDDRDKKINYIIG